MGNGDAPVAGQDESPGYVGIGAATGTGSSGAVPWRCTGRRGSSTDFFRAKSSYERYWDLPLKEQLHLLLKGSDFYSDSFRCCFSFYQCFIPFSFLFHLQHRYEQDPDSRFAHQPRPPDPGATATGAPGLRLRSPALLPAPPGRAGILHQAHPRGQECSLQTVQLRVHKEREALSQRCSQT